MSTSNFKTIKKKRLEERLTNLIQRYEVIFAQREGNLNAGNDRAFEIQLNQLEEQIKKTECELESLEDLQQSRRDTDELINECLCRPLEIAEVKGLFDRVGNLPSSDELRRICRKCIPEHLSLPINCNENCMLTCLLDWLAKMGCLSSGETPILEFVTRLMDKIHESSILQGLKAWIKTVAQHLGLTQAQVDALLNKHTDTPEPSSSASSYLLIQMDLKNKTLETYIVQAWLLRGQNTIQIYPDSSENEDKTFTIVEMPQLVDEILEDIYQKFCIPKKQLTIEFFLPKHLLSHQVDHWTTETVIDEPIGCRYRVVVRSLERFENTKLLHRLYDYWDSNVLQKTPDTCVTWLEKPELTGLRTKLEKGIIFFALKFVPEKNFIFKLITLGVPFVFWPRQLKKTDEVNELTTLLSCNTCHQLEQLPELIRLERLRIVDEEIDKQYITYHLSLLWDDYDRPLPTTSFVQNFSNLEGN